MSSWLKSGVKVRVAPHEHDVRLGRLYYERGGAIGPRFRHEVCTVETVGHIYTKLRGYRYPVATEHLYPAE